MARLSNPNPDVQRRSRGSSRGGTMEKLMSAEEVAHFLGAPRGLACLAMDPAGR